MIYLDAWDASGRASRPARVLGRSGPERQGARRDIPHICAVERAATERWSAVRSLRSFPSWREQVSDPPACVKSARNA